MAKILIVGSSPISLINFRGDLLRALIHKGHEVIVCSSAPSPDVLKSLLDIGVKHFTIPFSRTGLNFIHDLQALFFCYKVLRRENPSKILAYTIKPIIYMGIATRILRKNGFYAMITGISYSLKGSGALNRILFLIVKKLYQLALYKSSGVFFQNPDNESFFKKNYLISNNTSVTQINGSGVNLDWYKVAPLPSQLIFLLTARLLIDKGVREYFLAAKQIKALYPQVHFYLVGKLDSNPMSISQNELQKVIKEGAIEYMGHLDDVRPVLAKSKVFVLPSYAEGTPRCVLEAMAMGRAIITTNAPGCRETVIDGENGFLIKVKSVYDLFQSMEKFISDNRLAERMGQRSREMAEDKYDVDKVNLKILNGMGIE